MQKRVLALETNRPLPEGADGKRNHGTPALFDESPPRRIDAPANPCLGGIDISAVGNGANPNSHTALSPGPATVIVDPPHPPATRNVAVQRQPMCETSAGNANNVINLVTDSEGEGENPTITSEVRSAPHFNLHTLPNIVIIDDDVPVIGSQQGQSPVSPVRPPRTPVLSIRSPRLLERVLASQEMLDQALCNSLQTPPLFSASATNAEQRWEGPANIGYAARVPEETEDDPEDVLPLSQVYPKQTHGSVNQTPVTPVTPLSQSIVNKARKNDRQSDMGVFWRNDSDSDPKNDDEDIEPVPGSKRPRLGRLRRYIDCSSGEEDEDGDNGDAGDGEKPMRRTAPETSPIRRSLRFRKQSSSIPTRKSPRLNKASLKEAEGANSEPEAKITPPRKSPRLSQTPQNRDNSDADIEMTPPRRSPRFSQTPQKDQIISDREPGAKPVVIAGVAVSDDSGSDKEKCGGSDLSQNSTRAQRRKSARRATIENAERTRKLRLLGYIPEEFGSEDEETSPDEEINPPYRRRRRARKDASVAEGEEECRNGDIGSRSRRMRRIRKIASAGESEEGSSEEESVPLSRRRRRTRRTAPKSPRKTLSTTRKHRQTYGYEEDDFVVEDGQESEESGAQSSPPKRARTTGNESQDDSVVQVSSSSSSDSEHAPRTEVEKEHANQVKEAMGGAKVPRGLQEPIICYICRLQGNRIIGTPENGWRDGWIQPVNNFSVNVQKGNYGVRMTVPYCLMHTAGDQNRYIEQLQYHVMTTQGEAQEEGWSAPRTVQNPALNDEEEEEHSEGWRHYAEDSDSDDDDDFIVPSSDE